MKRNYPVKPAPATLGTTLGRFEIATNEELNIARFAGSRPGRAVGDVLKAGSRTSGGTSCEQIVHG